MSDLQMLIVFVLILINFLLAVRVLFFCRFKKEKKMERGELKKEDAYNRSRTECFIHEFKRIQKKAFENSEKKGFWKANFKFSNDPEYMASKIALMHSELSELLECVRKDFEEKDKHCPVYKNAEIELADLVIRAMDFAEAYNLHLAQAIISKMEFNATRPPKHGKKF